MYQLILHHTYRERLRYPTCAIDVSGAENDGLVVAAEHVDTGTALGSGALEFKSPYARVRVPAKPIWSRLYALQIEVIVRVDTLGARRNLVEGADSFAFWIDEWGRLWGTFNGPQYSGGPATWHGASSGANSPDGITRTVPTGEWVTLRYEHDGFASLRLYIDGELVAANYSLIAGVPGVTAAGVNIGNWTIADNYQLDGAVDDVKIWRWDPDDGWGHFLCRDLDRQSAPCWAGYFDWLADMLRDPRTRARVIALMNCIARAQLGLLRQVRAKGEHAIEESERLAAEYRKLWCGGPIDSADMQRWQRRFVQFLLQTLGEQALQAFVDEVRLCYMRSELQDHFPKYLDPARCDRQLVGYIEGFVAALGSIATPGSK